MDFKNLFDDDRAVSPVIGVILMVAITVILAAVIGTFVLGLGDQVQTTTPTAQIGFDYGASNAVTITHESGQELEAGSISVKETGDSDGITMETGPFTAGDTIASGTYQNGETIRVVWTSDGGQSSTLAQSEAP